MDAANDQRTALRLRQAPDNSRPLQQPGIYSARLEAGWADARGLCHRVARLRLEDRGVADCGSRNHPIRHSLCRRVPYLATADARVGGQRSERLAEKKSAG